MGMLRSLFILLLLGPAGADPERPNIVWINAEDLSPHFGCYGDPHALTPSIDGLAARGVLYRNAFATAPICSPSRSCLATGLYATSLGTQHLRSVVRLPERITPLPALLRRQGYFCSITGKTDYNFDPKGLWDVASPDPAPWRARPKGAPFFAFITAGETHEGPTNFQERYEAATASLPAEARRDPSKIAPPPFYPDTPEIRRVFANLRDLAAVFDRKVGALLRSLEDDGDLENTVVFVFSDHGNGLPRYKRWLNDSGLRVPLVAYVPPKFRDLSPHAPGTASERLVSFVDFAASALSLAGAPIPKEMPGAPFLGRTIAPPRTLVYGARDRADDMFELSRSVSDGRWFYVRHYLPHLPYVQDSVITGDAKRSYRELRRLHLAGRLKGPPAALWEPRKPREELYDLRSDPHELRNLADAPEHAAVKARPGAELRRWILEHRDAGLLPEAEYQIRARDSGRSPYDVLQDPALDLAAVLDAAERVGDPGVRLEVLLGGLAHPEAAVRYWSAVALHARGAVDVPELEAALKDPSPSVRIAAAEARAALAPLGELLQDERPWVSLQAARALALLGERSRPLRPLMEKVRAGLDVGGGRYKDSVYASFTGWALETALREK